MKLTVKGLFALAVFGFAFTACKKDYNCVCTQNGTTYQQFQYTDMEESGAVSACAADEVLLEQTDNVVLDCTVSEK